MRNLENLYISCLILYTTFMGYVSLLALTVLLPCSQISIKVYYNHEKKHSTNGYLSPVDCERQWKAHYEKAA